MRAGKPKRLTPEPTRCDTKCAADQAANCSGWLGAKSVKTTASGSTRLHGVGPVFPLWPGDATSNELCADERRNTLKMQQCIL